MTDVALRTARLRLRRWRAADLTPFAALNADPAVAEFLGGALSKEESDALAARIDEHFVRHAFGLWAVEIVDGAPFAGFTGLTVVEFEAHFTPRWRSAGDSGRSTGVAATRRMRPRPCCATRSAASASMRSSRSRPPAIGDRGP